MLRGEPKLFRPENPGPEFVRRPAIGDQVPALARWAGCAQIVWTGAAPGVPSVTTTLTVYDGLDVIDLDVELVKPARLGPESVFVALPFDVAAPRFLMETAGAAYVAGDEQLPDTSEDWYSIQHAVGVTGSTHGVLWGSFDAPLVQVGGFHTGQWAHELAVAGGQVDSWLMNNLHFTNFQAQQDGTGGYRYRFAPVERALTAVDVLTFGRDLLEPLAARQYAGPVVVGPSGLRVEPADRLLAEVRPVAAGVRVRLRNPGPAPVAAAVVWGGRRHEVPVPAHEVADVLLLP